MTTLPAPITARKPIRTPGRISAPPPTRTFDPISTGYPVLLLARSAVFNGCVGIENGGCIRVESVMD